MWKAQYFLVFLVQTQLLSCHLYVRGEAQVCYPGPPETKPAKFLDAIVELQCLQVTTLSEGHVSDLPQGRRANEGFQARVLEGHLLYFSYSRVWIEDNVLQLLTVSERMLSDHQLLRLTF